MKTRTMRLIVATAALLLLATGAAGALPALLAPGDPVSSEINYQGRLTDPDGRPQDGTFPMRFQVYDDPTSGTVRWDSGLMDVEVDNGLFSVPLGVDPAPFNGQGLWLRFYVDGEWLAPRQALAPVPYALSLKPGAEVAGSTSEGWILKAVNSADPATGAALWGEAVSGAGVHGQSIVGSGVTGTTANENSYAAAGVWGSLETGDGTAVRGYKAGDMGIAVLGTNYGNTGSGVVGQSTNHVGVWASSDVYVGLLALTGAADDNYGVYTDDNLYSLNYHLAGAIMHLAQNGGAVPLEPGDVAVFSGVAAPLQEGGPPVLQVARAAQANSTAVAGVVHSRYNVEVLTARRHPTGDASGTGRPVTLDGPVPPGGTLLLVVHGPAQVNASAVGGAIRIGDLLSAAGPAGSAARAPELTLEGVRFTAPGTAFGKALEPLDAGKAQIAVFVTLQ